MGGGWWWGDYRFLDDVESLLVDLERGHLLHDLPQQDVLFVVVTLHRQLWRDDNNHNDAA